MGLFGEPNVEKMKARNNVRGLIRALGYQKVWGVCSAAAEVLGEIGGPCAMEPLIATLQDAEWYVVKAAAEALCKIGWSTDEGADGAVYWVAKNDWDRCVMIGAPAVVPLIAALQDAKWDVRKAAARALVKLYHDSQLDGVHQQIILSERLRIMSTHDDGFRMTAGSSDCAIHADNKGIGISFPV